MGIRLKAVLGTLFVFWPSLAMAGAWPTPDGQAQIISTTVYSTAGHEFDSGGKLSREASFKKLEDQIYFEYGVTSRLTAVVATSFQDVDYVGRNGRERFQGFGETQFGVQYTFLDQDRWVLSGRVSGLIGAGGEVFPDADLGTTGNGFEIRALAGRSYEFGKSKGFAELQAAYRQRGNAIPEEWRVDATVGIEPRKRLKLIGQGFYTSARNGLLDVDRVRGNQSLKLNVSAIYQRKENRYFQIGFYQTVWGKNIVREKAVTAGVWQKF